MATLAVQTGGKSASVTASTPASSAATSALRPSAGAPRPKTKPPPRKKNQQGRHPRTLAPCAQPTTPTVSLSAWTTLTLFSLSAVYAGFDELIKCGRAICKELLLPSSSATNPILARIHQLTNTSTGGPFPPALLTLSDPAITHTHLQLLVRLLTCRAGLRYQASFADSFPSYTGLRNLQLWGAPVGDQGARRLADALTQLPAVRTLCLYNCQLTSHGCTFLSTYLSQRDSCTLTALTLDHNRIGTEGLSNLMLGMKRHCPLTALSLSYCEMEPSACPVLQTLLLLPSSNLSSISLRGNALTHAVLATLANAVRDGSTVRTVDLTSTGICCVHEKAEMRQLLHALTERAANAQTAAPLPLTATSTSILSSSLGTSAKVIPAPPHSSSATKLTATTTSSSSASSTLPKPLQLPTGLRQLLLEGNVLGDDMMVEVVAALKQCPQMAEFEVSAFVEPVLYKQLRLVLRENRVRIAETEGTKKKAKSKKGKSKKKKKK